MGLGYAKVHQVAADGLQLVQTLVKGLVAAAVFLQSGQDLLVAALDGHELHDLAHGVLADVQVVHQHEAHLFQADLLDLVHQAHDLRGLVLLLNNGVKAA